MVMHNVYLFQPQYTTVVNGRINNWLPYAVGTVWSYAAQFIDIAENFQLKDIIFKREKIDNLLKRLENPAVCGFSCYLWNKNYCLTAAKEIKAKWPNCVIVFGGPEVSGKLVNYGFIDSLIHGEGEENFVDILRNIINKKDPSLFLSKKRLDNLNIPSPYLTGVFDKIIADNPDVLWAITLETNRGCPYSCTFCDWGSLTYSKVKKFEMEKIAHEINWLVDKPISYVYIADANFGIYKERDLEIARLLNIASQNSSIDLIGVQAAKNNTEIAFQIGQVLGEKYGGVTISVQSMNDKTLEEIKRKNLNINNIKKLLELSVQYNIPTYTELILGLPYETVETWKDGLAELLEIGQHNSVEMWFAELLENSELSQLDSRKKYGIKTITTPDYINLKNDHEWNGPAEMTELILSTNTMSIDDMVESYMYGWMIIQIHVIGYSQIISKYFRLAKNISYRKFYDFLFEAIKNDPFILPEYSKLKNTVKVFLESGKLNNTSGGHMLHSASGGWMYKNKTQLIDFIYNTASSIDIIPDWIKELQLNFIYDENHPYPITIDGDYNLLNSTSTHKTYKIIPKLSKTPTSLLLFTVRRKGLLKNNIY
jgi:hypothetical protein